MSCIFRCPDNSIVLMCKGADSVIEARLATQNNTSLTKTKSNVDKFANEGLRTLYLAVK